MITVFWDCKVIIHIDYLPQGDTNVDKYAASLDVMHEELKAKQPGKLHQHVLLQHDNA